MGSAGRLSRVISRAQRKGKRNAAARAGEVPPVLTAHHPNLWRAGDPQLQPPQPVYWGGGHPPSAPCCLAPFAETPRMRPGPPHTHTAAPAGGAQSPPMPACGGQRAAVGVGSGQREPVPGLERERENTRARAAGRCTVLPDVTYKTENSKRKALRISGWKPRSWEPPTWVPSRAQRPALPEGSAWKPPVPPGCSVAKLQRPLGSPGSRRRQNSAGLLRSCAGHLRRASPVRPRPPREDPGSAGRPPELPQLGGGRGGQSARQSFPPARSCGTSLSPHQHPLPPESCPAQHTSRSPGCTREEPGPPP